MSILEEIKLRKYREVSERKALYPTAALERTTYFTGPTVSLKSYLERRDLYGIIAEFKRKSPSKGWINKYASVEETTLGYMRAGASALSILTDSHDFGGKSEDLTTARKFNFCPILRKDFIIDEYQIVEARSIGADAVLLIAAMLPPEKLRELARFARSLGMESVFEVHTEEEVKTAPYEDIDIIGVNSRNLTDFSVDLKRTFDLKAHIPDGTLAIAESGISSVQDIRDLRGLGFKGFLIGELFMKTSRPSERCEALITELG